MEYSIFNFWEVIILKEVILDFINRNNNLDEILLIVIGIVIGEILTVFWKSLATGIKRIFKFI